MGAAQPGRQTVSGVPDRSETPQVQNRTPDANDPMQMREQQAKQQNIESANAEPKKQIAEDSANLLKLATELKAEVDKTTKDTLSLTVIRKADAIEKLAHDVKEKMKHTVGAS
jgi:predicted transcriptional regulator